MAAYPSIYVFLFFLVHVFMVIQYKAQGEIPQNSSYLISEANAKGPYIGIVVADSYELEPLLQSPGYQGATSIDVAGRRFRFGIIAGKKVVVVMTGLAMVNAGITTQLLLSLFNVKGVVHYGIAGNANPSLHVGDVTIPQYWAHLGLWNWQRYGRGIGDKLALEAQGDYSRKYGNIRFAGFTTNISKNDNPDNLLNYVWYQAEEIFPVDGAPEQRQHIFWIPVDARYFNVAKKLKNLELEQCLNATTCIETKPRVVTVRRGASASIFVDNAAYRATLYNKFNISPIEMESAGVALICNQQKIPFISVQALSDLAGGGSGQSNEANTFLPLASTNAVTVVMEFIKSLP